MLDRPRVMPEWRTMIDRPLSLGPFTDQPELDELAHRLFRQFARSEYALKAAGFLKREDGAAEANWLAFADGIDPDFQDLIGQSEPLRLACSYINKSPPKKQVVRDGELGWDETAPDAKTATGLIIAYVNRVRNNLFHGGKFNGAWIDPARSQELLKHALIILDHAIPLSARVLAAYEH